MFMALLSDSRTNEAARPSQCPFCNGRVLDTLAKVITPTTTWRCLSCDKTFTTASLKPPSLRP
jgi:ribosomal protein L37AE/L43A